MKIYRIKTLSINRIDIVGISGNDICDRFGKVKYSLEHGEDTTL